MISMPAATISAMRASWSLLDLSDGRKEGEMEGGGEGMSSVG